ncbi:MAG: cytochrome c biogenesis protein CcsA [Firmicutes bacterium]|nr:cytochrome c biogenesis protein CcsA [Bacillota bacterium]
MTGLGEFGLTMAFGSGVYAWVAGWLSVRPSWRGAYKSVRGAMIAVALAYTTAVLSLEVALVTNDFSVRAVYNHSDTTLPILYKIAALWGGDSGSVLFWGWLLSLYTAYLAWRCWHQDADVIRLVGIFLASLEIFFAGLSRFVVNPFAPIRPGLPNGAGLDPLLQNPVMVIHPPLMYLGLIGLAVPTAYWVAGLWLRRDDTAMRWRIRQWLLWAWTCLGSALVLGGIWAYLELGWGGYWEWDPVENAALLPWLTATAWLHGIQLDNHRGPHRGVSHLLASATFLLTLVATYITRSGVLKNSVHSFTGTGIGPYFVGLFWVSALSLSVVWWARRDLLVGHPFSSVGWTKALLVVVTEALLSGIAGVVLCGTFYPVFSKALTGHTVVLGRGFFNATTAPLFVSLVGLLGWLPWLRWRGTMEPRDRQALFRIAGIALGGGLVLARLGYHGLAWMGGTLGVFALLSLAKAFFRPGIGRPAIGREGLRRLWRQRGRLGTSLAHAAFVVVAMGVMISQVRQVSRLGWLRTGAAWQFEGYRVRYQGLKTELFPGHVNIMAQMAVREGRQHWTMVPGLAFFPGSEAPLAVVAIHSAVMRDLYIVIEDATPRRALVDVMVNPAVMWIWLGSAVMMFGSLAAFTVGPGRRGAALKVERRLQRTRPSQDLAAGPGDSR